MWFPATVLAHVLLRLGNSSVYYIWHLCSLPYRVCVSLGGVNFFFFLTLQTGKEWPRQRQESLR